MNGFQVISQHIIFHQTLWTYIYFCTTDPVWILLALVRNSLITLTFFLAFEIEAILVASTLIGFLLIPTKSNKYRKYDTSSNPSSPTECTWIIVLTIPVSMVATFVSLLKLKVV